MGLKCQLFGFTLAGQGVLSDGVGIPLQSPCRSFWPGASVLGAASARVPPLVLLSAPLSPSAPQAEAASR